MEGTKKTENVSKNKTETHHQNDHHKTSTSLQNPQSRETKVLTTVMPCYETTRTSVQRNDDSLESLLDGYLLQGSTSRKTKDKNHHKKKKSINYEMIEDTLLECLNLTRNPSSLKRMSHTILQYFTYVVLNQIKNNYYKQLSKKRKSNWGRHQDSTVLFFNRKYACNYALQNARKKNRRERSSVSSELVSHSKVEQEMPAITPSNQTQPHTDYSNPEIEGTTEATIHPDACEGTKNVSSRNLADTTKDAFLCNIPNAPPFILKMNKAFSDKTSTTSYPEDTKKAEERPSSSSITSTDDSSDMEELCTSASCMLRNTCSTYTEIPEFNMFIDGNCPGFQNREFETFVAKSITWIKTEGARRSRKPCGLFMSTPTICMAGLTSLSNNPFELDEIDSRRPGKNTGSFPNADVLYKQNSSHYHSKIPRMLHPGKCKMHAKMKNVQLSPGSKGCAANKSSACSGPCPSEKTEIQINPYVKVSVSTTCPSLTNTSASGNVKAGGGKQPVNKNKNANIQASQSSVGDCMKGIKSDPGCYCGNEPVEPTPCPIRLREDCECVEEEAEAQTAEPEDDEALCYCPPGEQPLLMKKSNIECDCANRRRCEDEILVEPPKEKPNVFWALTKVSLLKDGTKNFEIIDVSPVPPGYYLMPDVNNLVLVGPQPKPARAAPSKNCCCK